MEFIIDKSKWRAGGNGIHKIGRGNVELLNSLGYMCCLGQCELQLGLTKKQILLAAAPSDTKVHNELTEYSQYLDQFYNNELSTNAMLINDNSKMDTNERINKLTKLFEKHGHTIKFINEEVTSDKEII